MLESRRYESRLECSQFAHRSLHSFKGQITAAIDRLQHRYPSFPSNRGALEKANALLPPVVLHANLGSLSAPAMPVLPVYEHAAFGGVTVARNQLYFYQAGVYRSSRDNVIFCHLFIATEGVCFTATGVCMQCSPKSLIPCKQIVQECGVSLDWRMMASCFPRPRSHDHHCGVPRPENRVPCA